MGGQHYKAGHVPVQNVGVRDWKTTLDKQEPAGEKSFGKEPEILTSSSSKGQHFLKYTLSCPSEISMHTEGTSGLDSQCVNFITSSQPFQALFRIERCPQQSYCCSKNKHIHCSSMPVSQG